MNEHILRVNQDVLSIPVSPFSPSPESFSGHTQIPTHWSGPLSGGETVLMIINPSDSSADIQFRWTDIPAFANSTAPVFRFAEISTGDVWRSGSRVGFLYEGVPAHGSLVLIVWEDEMPTSFSWARRTWDQDS